MKFQKTAGLFIFVLAAFFMMAGTGVCDEKEGYNYISVDEFKARMDAGEHENGLMAIVTTQTEEEYASGHIKAAYPTYARPLIFPWHYSRMDPFMELVQDTDEDIILICPRGHSGAERPFDYFKRNGIAEERMFILKDGQEAFNRAYPDNVTYGN